MSKRGEAILLASDMPFKPKTDSAKEGDEPTDDMPDDMELSEGEKTAAEDLMVAIKDDDSDAIGKALKRFMQMG